ncbi:centromere-associated protein E [Scomber scombrus]|uniref:centromere-associated protein E n=1 Tax=Scomber scombrus TaxID=13677 RepID=UPI002DDA3A21|nr:centromere-associated protein E [Scomber scombrus]
MTEESAVKVCVRVRPLIESAASEEAKPVQLFWKADKKSIHQIDDGNSTKSFSFDRVFIAEETTKQLYQGIAKPLVVSAVEGYNGTIFAYGQTSSGKTFTMMGSKDIPGVIPLAVDDVFQTIKNRPNKEFLLRVSYMEIYNETVTDLLVDSWKRKPLEVREAINKNIYVADLTEELVTSPAQALAWILKGEKNRHYGKTKMNQRSSRSHTIFRMILESRERSDPASGENADGAIIVSHLNLVDLAGSERASQTGAEGARFKEGCNINRSLFTLGQVIKKLTDENQKGFTNYRDSKLTRILQNSLGGNAKTVIICTITPVTLDETLSTLQFASTAKKMKNDPHVTEVSDDGALLKRYRNEIVDLKRRLHEVSSVTQTTATEKEVLSQLLQEKDQLQREQEDRIKNLTKLIVTSSNVVLIKKKTNRRATCPGNMLQVARLAAFKGSDLSFAEPFYKKRKADRSCLMELTEDNEDFDTHWGIPDEPSDDMEMSQSSVTTRSFGDSPHDSVTPDRMRELSGKVSNLEVQLEMENQQKETLNCRVAELEQQLQAEAQQKQEALEKMQISEQRAAELDLQLQAEAQQKQEALEKMQISEQRAAELNLQLQAEVQQTQEALENVEMLELRVADLERQLEEQTRLKSEADKEMRKEFEETIRLCETLAAEKDVVATERDYLKQELGMFIEQTDSLEKEKNALSHELEEKREMEEFKSLEEDFRQEQETELQNEISSTKKALESSELQCLQLQKKLETVSEELKKKTQFAEDLQSMNGKDLVQEVAKLRRSLDDAEGVSRDTKKEWAHLRSQNIALEEMNGTLAANHDKMESEVNSLRSQLATEKSRYQKMQTDLQKELNVAFDENTKLTTLLDGKVPKNLIDSVDLERTVSNLNKELAASREAEGALRAQLEELASLQALPNKVDNLMKQVCELTEELCAVQSQRDDLLSAQAGGQEEAQQLRDSLQTSQDEILRIQADLSAAAQRAHELSQQFADATQQLEALRSHLEHSDEEKNQLMATNKETDLKLEESEQHRASLEEELQLVKDMEEKLADSEASRATEEEISKELQEQLSQLTEELQCVRAEKDALLSEQSVGVQSSAEETEKLFSTVTSLTAERDQLNRQLQENVEMAAETQGLFQSLQEELQEQKQKNADLLKLHEEKEHSAERNAGVQSSAEETELLSTVTSLTEERDQLKEDLQENVEMMIEIQEELRAALEKNQEQKAQIKQLVTAQASSSDVPPSDMSVELLELQTHNQRLTEELESVRADRDSLQCERTADPQTDRDQMKELLSRVTSLSEERDQLQEILEGLREEKKQLKAELEDRMDMVVQSHTGFNQPEMLSSELQAQDETATQLQQEIEKLQATLQAVSEQKSQVEAELQRNIEMAAVTQTLLHSLQEQLRVESERNLELERLGQEQQAQLQQQAAETQSLLHSLQEELQEQKQKNSDLVELKQKECDLEQHMKTLTEELESVRAERNSLLFEKESSCSTSTEEMLEGLRKEKKQLRAELEDRMDTLQTEMRTLTDRLQSVEEERDSLLSEKESSCQTSTEEMKELLSRVTSLSEERDQLQEMLEGLREEKKQLRAELEDRMDTLQTEMRTLTDRLQSVEAERDSLLSEKEATSPTSTEEMKDLLSRVTSLSEERDQLQEILEGLREEKKQLRAQLEDRMDTLQTEMRTLTDKLQRVETERDSLLSEKESSCQTSTEEMKELLSRVTSLSEERDQLQEILEGLREEKKQLKAELEDRMDTLQTEMRTLTDRLQSVEAERDSLLSEKEATSPTSTEEMKELLSRVTSLSEERDQLQEILEGLREEKKQLRAELEDNMNTTVAIQEKLSEQEQINVQQQAERGKRESRLQQEVQQLEEKLKTFREKQTLDEAEAYASQQSLSDVNTTVTSIKERTSSRLQDSDLQLQESFKRFQHFKDICSKNYSGSLDRALTVQRSLKPQEEETFLPKHTMNTYRAVGQLKLQTAEILGNIWEHLQMRAQGYKNLFEGLVKKDLAVFEERCLQDVLQCRAQAPSSSIKDEGFSTMWEHRLTELLEKRRDYLQKMSSILEKLWASIASYPPELLAEIKEEEKFKEQFQAVCTKQPISFSSLDNILSCYLNRRTAVAQRWKMTLQSVIDEQQGLCEELEQLEAQAESQLREERSKSFTLQPALQGAPRKTELSLLKDNQQLALQLQQAEEKVKALCAQNEQLEEAEIKANSRVSNHKQATQLLQTELQDSRAQVEEHETTIQCLKSKLRESETTPSSIELEKLRTKLFKMEMELSSSSDQYKQEIQRMTTVLNEKEESLRKLKETLRKSQQQGEDSILQGEDIHARLTNPRGLLIKSSVHLEKTKLEDEVRQLQLKISELESLVSSQHAEINKWKSRAFKLKTKTKLDKPPSPCTPTKRGLPMTSDSSNFLNSPKKKVLDSPRKLLDSPKVSLQDSPKSRFFDIGGSSELLSRSYPKQFFDNSNLGTIPDAAAGGDRQEWWPQSPNQQEMCKQQ